MLFASQDHARRREGTGPAADAACRSCVDQSGSAEHRAAGKTGSEQNVHRGTVQAIALGGRDPSIAACLSGLERSLALDASAPCVPAVTLAFVYSQQGRQDDALAVLDHMPSPSTMEPQYAMVRAIVFARQGKVDEARGLWQHLLDYTRQPQDAPPEQVLRQFMINPEVIRRASQALREAGVVAPQTVAR